MRWYRLTLGESVFEAGKSNLLKNILKTSAEINIQFEISVYENNANSTISTITLYNMSLEWFLQMQSKKGLSIKLEAGFNESAPMIKKMGYSKNLNSLLLNASVQNMIGDFSGIQSSVTIYTMAYIQQKEPKLELAIKAGDSPAKKIVDYLNSNDNPLRKNGNLIITFKADETAQNLVYNSNRSILGRGLESFLNDMQTMVFKDSKGKNVKLTYIIQADATCLIYSNLKDIQGATYSITARDFVKMPNQIDFSGRLQAILKLSPHYKVGDYVKISGVLPELSGAYSNIKMLSEGQDTTKLFYTGSYRIDTINHIGEYYNIASDSWTTQLELTPDEETTNTVTLTTGTG